MTTLISAGGGDWERRCDAKCHYAKGPVCDCVCGGRLHGKGDAAGQELTDAVGASEFMESLRARGATVQRGMGL